MGGYERDEYEDYDDYEEDEGEQDEEYEEEEEEDPKPSKEELEYLEFRQRMKERIRKQMMKKEGASASQAKKKLPYDNFGSFFGPSKPVIAQRVIQESKSLLENQHLATRVLQSQYKNQKSSSSTSTGSRPVVRDKMPKVVNAVNQKVQKLKDTRDYSFLLSDDAEVPAPVKQAASRHTSAPSSEARPAKMPLPSRQASGSNGRIPQNVRDDRRPSSINGQTNSRAGPTKLSSTTKSNSMLAADKRQLHNNNGNGAGRPAVSNGLQQKRPLAITGKTSQVAKISAPVMSKPPAAKMPSPAMKHNVQQRKDVGNLNKHKIAPKQSVASIKPQMNKPPKQISSAVRSQDQKPKKKPIRPFSDDEDDGEMAINMIRKMFRYNPQKYAGRDDDDDSDMEANFDEIMKEEKRSAKIARKEDEEQQRLLEEEERQEQMRKMAKKRKLSR